jgi:hypothetical protein
MKRVRRKAPLVGALTPHHNTQESNMDYALVDQRNARGTGIFLAFILGFPAALGILGAAANPNAGVGGIVLWIIFGVLYLVPAIIAVIRAHHNAIAITVVNFLLGWTFLGWVAALVWACTAKRS